MMTDRSAKELVENAEGNIKKKHLTKDSGMVFTYLYDGPLIEYLSVREQPEYIFSHEWKGYRIIKPNGDERTPHHDKTEGKRYLLITDQRIIYVAGRKEGDESIGQFYHDITNIERTEDNNIRFYLESGKIYEFTQNGSIKEPTEAAVNYVSEQITRVSDSTDSDGNISEFDFQKIKPLSNIDADDIKDLKNDFVPQNIVELDENIGENETFHYANEIQAVITDDGVLNRGEAGCLLVTDKGLTAHINEKDSSSSHLSLDYNEIDTADVAEVGGDGEMLKITVQSASETTEFCGFENISMSDIFNIVNFIRDRANNPETDDVSGSESNADPTTEKLKKIKELHDQGVLTDEEFEEKKESLLDEI